MKGVNVLAMPPPPVPLPSHRTAPKVTLFSRIGAESESCQEGEKFHDAEARPALPPPPPPPVRSDPPRRTTTPPRRIRTEGEARVVFPAGRVASRAPRPPDRWNDVTSLARAPMRPKLGAHPLRGMQEVFGIIRILIRNWKSSGSES
ncbi:unnamed protein product [Prorocentrum cordatum]|uniref:Uncharacterized protein n=1 Tax=Prorocentrum cordatum TaxID=2364126 RepID=A0ABN9ULQ8_9DINO|nr:unnamed protein product [Polarella glacialis]